MQAKRLIIVGASAIMALFGIASASAQSDGTVTDIPWSNLTGPLAISQDASLPTVHGQKFKLVSAEFRSSTRFGCDGVFHMDVFHNLRDQFSETADYLRRNALGMASNFLVYSQPTLYNLMNDMNIRKDFSDQQLVASCQTVRESARQSRTEKEIEARALELCIAKEGPVACETNKGAAFVAEARKERGDGLREAISNNGGGSASGPADTRAVIAAKIEGEELQDLVNKILPGREYTEEGVVSKPREVSTQDLIEEEAIGFGTLLESLVATPSADRANSEAAKNFMAQPAIKAPSMDVVNALSMLRVNAPTEYQIARNAMATQMAVAHLTYKAAQLRATVLNGTFGESGDALGEDDINDLMRGLDLIQAELSMYEARFDSQLRQGALERLVIERSGEL